MQTKKFGPLYAKASTGKIKTWEATIVIESDGRVTFNTLHGYIDGKKASNSKIIKGKNIGKANETSPFNQGVLEASSKMREKMDEGYVENQNDLKDQVLFLPMLAHKYQERKHDIIFPCYVQPKLNGVRCLARQTENNPEYISRGGKFYPVLDHLDKETQSLIDLLEVPLDGEIYIHGWNLQEISRAVKKDRGETTDQLEYWVYDIVDTTQSFEDRYKSLYTMAASKKLKLSKIKIVETHKIANEKEFFEWHEKFCSLGYEGTIIRNLDGKYVIKNRSKDLQKYKDFEDAEFKIVGGEEATGNDAGTIVFICEISSGSKFKVRPKGSREIRSEWWKDLKNIIGKDLTVRYKGLSEDGIPLTPVGICIRDYE